MKKKLIKTMLDGAEHTINEVEHEVDVLMQPVRRSVFERFPILFLLLVTFGVVAIFFGFEQLIAQTPYLSERPLLVLSIGITVLVGTGTLYKKL
tara:strand:+ start:1412 stop:1693 length:282 start_codon:yes stop_codon:yes gene_type:complete